MFLLDYGEEKNLNVMWGKKLLEIRKSGVKNFKIGYDIEFR